MSFAADPVPLSVDVVKGMSVEELAKTLAATDLQRPPLRLVMSEKASSQPAVGKLAEQMFYHVIWVEPGSRRMRYDRVDYNSSNHAPYVVSSFTDGASSGRWESGLKDHDVPRLLKGDDSIERGGMCYLGPTVCYSPQIVLRVLGLTMMDKPMAEAVRALGAGATITPDASGDGLVVETRYKKLMLNERGVLRQYLMYETGHETGDGGELTILESILVTETGLVGTTPLPTQVCRRVNFRGRSKESIFELKLEDCRVIKVEEMAEAINPVLPRGTPLVGGKPDQRMEEEGRVFGEGDAVGKQKKGE